MTTTKLTTPARPLPHQELASGPMPAAVVDVSFLVPAAHLTTYVVPAARRRAHPVPLAA